MHNLQDFGKPDHLHLWLERCSTTRSAVSVTVSESKKDTKEDNKGISLPCTFDIWEQSFSIWPPAIHRMQVFHPVSVLQKSPMKLLLPDRTKEKQRKWVIKNISGAKLAIFCFSVKRIVTRIICETCKLRKVEAVHRTGGRFLWNKRRKLCKSTGNLNYLSKK